MIRHFFHNTLDGEVSSAWYKHSAIKITDAPRIVVCIPIGSKLSQNIVTDKNGEIIGGPTLRIPATVPVQWLTSQMTLIHPLNTSVVYMTQYGMYAGEARQVLTMNALRNVQDDGYVLYWDDDTLPPNLGLYTMMNYMEQHPEVGLLSAVYSTRLDPCEPVLYKAPTTGVNWNFSMGDEAEPEEVFSAGAGFMLVRVAAIRKAIEMNPGVPVWADMKLDTEPGERPDPDWGAKLTWGHDIRFCRLIAQAGYKVMVDGRVECGHLDISTQRIYKLPENCLPKRRGREYRGQGFWNRIYTRVGVQQITEHGMLLVDLLQRLPKHSKIVEIGCGAGVFGMLAAAQGGCEWTGFDSSEVAVEICNGHFLNAYVRNIYDITEEDLEDADVIVAPAKFEFNEPEDQTHILALAAKLRKRLLLTLPVGTALGSIPPAYRMSRVGGDEARDLIEFVPAEDDNATDDSSDRTSVRASGLREENGADVQEELHQPDVCDSSGRLHAGPECGRVLGLGQ